MKEGTTGVILVDQALPRHSKIIIECAPDAAMWQCGYFHQAMIPGLFKGKYFAPFIYKDGQIFLYPDAGNIIPLPQLPLELAGL